MKVPPRSRDRRGRRGRNADTTESHHYRDGSAPTAPRDRCSSPEGRGDSRDPRAAGWCNEGARVVVSGAVGVLRRAGRGLWVGDRSARVALCPPDPRMVGRRAPARTRSRRPRSVPGSRWSLGPAPARVRGHGGSGASGRTSDRGVSVRGLAPAGGDRAPRRQAVRSVPVARRPATVRPDVPEPGRDQWARYLPRLYRRLRGASPILLGAGPERVPGASREGIPESRVGSGHDSGIPFPHLLGARFWWL